MPFLLLTGWTFSVTVFVFATMGFGFFKGMYDANIGHRCTMWCRPSDARPRSV